MRAVHDCGGLIVTESLDGILGAILGAPALPGAKCRRRWWLFDEQRPNESDATAAARHTQALGLCSRCQSLDPCRAWFDGLPARERPGGVIAGRVNRWTAAKKANK